MLIGYLFLSRYQYPNERWSFGRTRGSCSSREADCNGTNGYARGSGRRCSISLQRRGKIRDWQCCGSQRWTNVIVPAYQLFGHLYCCLALDSRLFVLHERKAYHSLISARQMKLMSFYGECNIPQTPHAYLCSTRQRRHSNELTPPSTTPMQRRETAPFTRTCETSFFPSKSVQGWPLSSHVFSSIAAKQHHDLLPYGTGLETPPSLH